MKRLLQVLVVLMNTGIVLAQVPEENRFQKVVLTENLNEPLELTVLPDERVLFIERHGVVKMYNPASKKTTLIATIPVSTKYTDGSEAEDGLLGMNIDPNFSKNHWVYLYYSPAGNVPENILTRFELKANILDLNTKKIILKIPVQRDNCCHTGGSIDWDAQANLYLSTGDNTSPRASDGYSPIDERPGKSPFDAQKSSANTADLRGKIIRIHPEADGSYSIPEGNLFPRDAAKTRPEIYTMGHRNPYRISVDPKTDFLYWGDVGPDAGRDSTGFGPAAEDEFGQARQAGNYGWPYFVGDNKAYWDYDFETKKSGDKFNPEKPVNNSPNNTGLTELPAAQKAFIWYPAAETKRFPLLGSGGRSAMAGPVFYVDQFKNAKRPFPTYYDKKLFIYEWMRDWIIAVTLSPKGDYVKMERFLPNLELEHPIDMAFGPNGDLYVLEYGQGWFMGNPESKLVRIEYNGGNRKPSVVANADKNAGALPFNVQFSSDGTTDFDKDSLQYQWKITGPNGVAPIILKTKNPAYTFRKAGVYQAMLTVTDTHGSKGSQTLTIKAGNEPPEVTLNLVSGNKTFFFPGKPIQYQVNVSDKEDGSLESKRIAASKVKITAAYQDAEDQPKTAAGHQEAPVTFTAGKTLIEKSDCKACHFQDKKSIGPSFKEVAAKYKSNAQAVDMLSDKIIKGGAGVWGETAMSAHPSIGLPEAGQMVKYILSLANEKKPATYLQPQGQTTVDIPEGGDANKGIYKFLASYTDNGSKGLPAQTTEKSLTLRSPTLMFGNADDASKQLMRFKMGETNLLIVMAANTSATFRQIDLTGISELSMIIAAPIERLNSAGGIVEVRTGSMDGPLLGKTTFVEPSDAVDVFSPAAKPVPFKVPIEPVTGFHDLYFVFKNDQAKGALFVPFSVTFLTK
ncbi:PQQ-dependent sugar dehydrogenase [Dyadobacter sp. CY326]|uniref:PQQ-dependent sugar dehydrogenase n=1 Tax=Dyadobacter sp. CY326 TaxID=2907300 RepID=UPI001F2ABB8A|nr:PQQ-dependent sugar dehydrogenase [Dyadobacter sp. CY326]MCE7065784.1 PQQ-dependent sugar dehydrogenase [Dyadobacter sp. CY326]